jgi:dihydropteroate synthase
MTCARCSRDGALEAAAATGLPVCLMHMLGEPGTCRTPRYYDHLVGEVSEFLGDRIAQCAAVGIAPERIILDPGFGFAKTLQHNLSLFKHMEALHALGRPLLVGVSRKSMIGHGLESASGRASVRQPGSGGIGVTKGARILRVHDVAETVDVVRMIAAVDSAD